MNDELAPHPALTDDTRCRVRTYINGHEWICIKPVHDDPPGEHGQRSVQWQHGYPPKSERHYYVRRWPNSDR